MTPEYAVRTDRVRLLYFVQRSPSLTYEEFVKYWREVHGPLFASLEVVKRNIRRYEQVTVDQEWKAKFQAMGARTPDYDGIIVYEADSIEKLTEVISNEEYRTKVAPDAVKFINLDTARYAFSHIAPIVRTKPSAIDDGVRFVANIVKRKDITHEAFSRHWVEKHSHIIIDHPGVRDVFGLYEQLHIIKDGVPPEILQQKSTTKLTSEWDGVVFIDGKSFEDIWEKLSEEEFTKIRAEDESKFLEPKPIAGMPMRVCSFIGS